MRGPASPETLLGAEVRAMDAQLQAGRALQLGLAGAVLRLTHSSSLHLRHASPGSTHSTAGRRREEAALSGEITRSDVR